MTDDIAAVVAVFAQRLHFLLYDVQKKKYIFHKNIISRVSLPCLVGKVSVKTQ